MNTATPATTRAPSSSLIVELQPVQSLSADVRGELCALLAQWFENVSRTQFESDLDEKQWIIVAREAASGRAAGFSTLSVVEAASDEGRVNALYSGDTIVAPQWWNSFEFFKAWIRSALWLAEQLPVQPAYWLLISSGFRTYRLLPTFFRTFVPCCGRANRQDLQHKLEILARAKFATSFDRSTGVVRLAHPTPVRRGVSELTAVRLRNPHVRFFASRNPGHAQGDELACLAELSRANLTKTGLRMLR